MVMNADALARGAADSLVSTNAEEPALMVSTRRALRIETASAWRPNGSLIPTGIGSVGCGRSPQRHQCYCIKACKGPPRRSSSKCRLDSIVDLSSDVLKAA